LPAADAPAESEVPINPMHKSKVKYLWQADSKACRGFWIAEIRRVIDSIAGGMSSPKASSLGSPEIAARDSKSNGVMAHRWVWGEPASNAISVSHSLLRKWSRDLDSVETPTQIRRSIRSLLQDAAGVEPYDEPFGEDAFFLGSLLDSSMDSNSTARGRSLSRLPKKGAKIATVGYGYHEDWMQNESRNDFQQRGSTVSSISSRR